MLATREPPEFILNIMGFFFVLNRGTENAIPQGGTVMKKEKNVEERWICGSGAWERKAPAFRG